MRSRGVRVEGLELRALVPVSIRSQHEHGQLGNRIAAMRGPLPVYCRNPVECLDHVRESMSDLKDSKQALGAEVSAGLQDFAPPTLLAQASRLNFSTRLFNVIVTNVPGPQFPLYLAGRELKDLFPMVPLAPNQALGIAIMSYNGQLNFGLAADYDALSDLSRLASDLQEAIAELAAAAGPGPRRPSGRRLRGRTSGIRAAGRRARPRLAPHEVLFGLVMTLVASLLHGMFVRRQHDLIEPLAAGAFHN